MDRQAYTWINGERQGERETQRERGAEKREKRIDRQTVKIKTDTWIHLMISPRNKHKGRVAKST